MTVSASLNWTGTAASTMIEGVTPPAALLFFAFATISRIAAQEEALVGEPGVLQLDYDAQGLHNGRVELVRVSAPPRYPPIASLTARLKNVDAIAFCSSADGRTWSLLVPIGIEHAPGGERLVVHATLADGRSLVLAKPVPVVAAAYDERSLSVDNKFLQPSAKDRLRAKREARTMTKVLSLRSPQRLWRGSFAKPVPTQETSPFGTRRTYNNKTKSRHLGWDLDGNVGDTIVSAGDGRVVLSQDRYFSGGTVVVDHGQGLFTMYFHMSQRAVAADDLVKKGGTLGRVGQSGRVTGPHLHFSLRLAGEYLDPKPFVALDLSSDSDAPAATAIHASAGAQR